jgi:hypothetical protein
MAAAASPSSTAVERSFQSRSRDSTSAPITSTVSARPLAIIASAIAVS